MTEVATEPPPPPLGDLAAKLRRALEDWDVVSAAAEIDKEEHRPWLVEHSWELVPLVCGYLSPPEVEAAAPLLAQCAQDLLLVVAKRGNPKENLVALLEQLDTFRSSAFLRRCLPALSLVLLKIKDKSKAHSWSWALSTVCCSLKTLTLPESTDFEKSERLAADLSKDSVECLCTLEVIVDFVQPLVQFAVQAFTAAAKEEESGDRVGQNEQCRVLRNFLLRVCDRPIAYLHQHPEASSTKDLVLVYPKSFSTAQRVVESIASLRTNPLADIVNLDLTEGDDEDEKISLLAVASYLYLLLGEGLGLEHLPSVYSPHHLLTTASRPLVHLLQQPHNTLTYKGVLLLQSLLKRLPPAQLGKAEVENPRLLNLFQPLVTVIVYNSAADCRQTGFECYKMLVELFSTEAKYFLYTFLLKTVNHSGLLGWTITQMKSSLLPFISNSTITSTSAHSQYSGEKIEGLVGNLFILQHGAETDLLEISDELIASIGLARVLLAQSAPTTTTAQVPASSSPPPSAAFTVGETLKKRIRTWANQIQDGLNLSRAHYELKLREDSGTGGGGESVMSVNVGGVTLPAMEPGRMREVVRSALLTFDLIHFNLVGLLQRLD